MGCRPAGDGLRLPRGEAGRLLRRGGADPQDPCREASVPCFFFPSFLIQPSLEHKRSQFQQNLFGSLSGGRLEIVDVAAFIAYFKFECFYNGEVLLF